MTFFGRGFELAVTFTHARVRVQNECENVETKAGIIRNQARRFSTDQDQRRCPSEERKRLTGSFLACLLNFMTLYR